MMAPRKRKRKRKYDEEKDRCQRFITVKRFSAYFCLCSLSDLVSFFFTSLIFLDEVETRDKMRSVMDSDSEIG